MRCMARSLLVVVLAAVSAAPSFAQNGGPVKGTVPPGVPNRPVYLTLERRSEQTLWDGTHLTRVTHELFLRDSKGRTRAEIEMGPILGTEVLQRTVIVDDPIAGVVYNWQTGNPNTRKVYIVSQKQPMRSVLETLPGGNQGMLQASALRPAVTRESLGPRMVGGFACVAQRITTVYPVDYFGNDRPITTVDEMCNSRDAGRVIQEKREDPRTGVVTLTLVSGSIAEPDASLLQPPADYTEQKMMIPQQP